MCKLVRYVQLRAILICQHMILMTTLPEDPPACVKSNLTYFHRNSLQLASDSDVLQWYPRQYQQLCCWHVGHASTIFDVAYSVPWLLYYFYPTIVNLWKKQKYFNSIKESFITHCVPRSETCRTNTFTYNIKHSRHFLRGGSFPFSTFCTSEVVVHMSYIWNEYFSRRNITLWKFSTFTVLVQKSVSSFNLWHCWVFQEKKVSYTRHRLGKKTEGK